MIVTYLLGATSSFIYFFLKKVQCVLCTEAKVHFFLEIATAATIFSRVSTFMFGSLKKVSQEAVVSVMQRAESHSALDLG